MDYLDLARGENEDRRKGQRPELSFTASREVADMSGFGYYEFLSMVLFCVV
jgi:hypothetical protein